MFELAAALFVIFIGIGVIALAAAPIGGLFQLLLLPFALIGALVKFCGRLGPGGRRGGVGGGDRADPAGDRGGLPHTAAAPGRDGLGGRRGRLEKTPGTADAEPAVAVRLQLDLRPAPASGWRGPPGARRASGAVLSVTVRRTAAGRSARLCTASTVPPRQSQRWAKTAGSPVSRISQLAPADLRDTPCGCGSAARSS